MPSREDLDEILVELFQLEGWIKEKMLPDHLRLNEDLALDSFDHVRLILALNTQFKFEIQSHEMTADNFSTVSRLKDLICSKLGSV